MVERGKLRVVDSEGGKVYFVVLSTFSFTLVNTYIELTKSIPSVRGDFFQGLITFFITLVVVIQDNSKFRVGGKGLNCVILHTAFNALKVLYGFCTMSRLMLSSTSVLGGVSPFFIVLFSFLLLGRGLGPTRTVTVFITFVKDLFVVGPAFAGVRLFPSIVNLYKKVNTNVTCTVMEVLNRENRGKDSIILFFSKFSYVIALPCLLFGFRPVAKTRVLTLFNTKLTTTKKRFKVATTCCRTPTGRVSVCSCSRVVFSAVLKCFLFKRIPSGCDILKCIVVLAVTT